MPVNPYSAYFSPMVLLRCPKDSTGSAWYDCDDLLALMQDFKFEDHLKKADMAVWTFVDPTGQIVDDSRFEPDTEWFFRFGYPGEISHLQRHKVKYYEPAYAEDGTIMISVTTMGKSMEMMRVKAAHNWGVRPSSDIAEDIARRYGFKTKIEVSKDDLPDCPYIQPRDMSDYEYLIALAECIDFEFFVEGDTLYYRSRESAYSEPPRHTFYWWGDSTPTLLKSFKPTIKATKPGKVKVSHTTLSGKKNKHPVVTNKNVKGRQLGTSKPTQVNKHDPDNEPQGRDAGAGRYSVDASTGEKRTITQVDLETGTTSTLIEESASAVPATADTNTQHVERQAQALKRHYLDQLVHANADFIGTPRIRAKATFEFRGLSPRLSGLWYCTEVTHTINASGYSTSATLKRGAYNATGKKKSKGQSPTNTATSTDASNTNQAGRVQISLETGESNWAPPASPAVP